MVSSSQPSPFKMSLLVFVRYSCQQRCLAIGWVCKSGVGHFTPTLCGLAGTNWTGKDHACGESRPTSIGKAPWVLVKAPRMVVKATQVMLVLLKVPGATGAVEGPRCYWYYC